MNERYTELEAQCWVQIPCDFDMAADGLSTVRTVFDREKFAKLLIEECIHVAIKAVSVDEENEAWYLIQQHFGVNE